MKNAIYFQVNVFKLGGSPGLNIIYLGSSGYYKTGETTEDQAVKETIVPVGAFIQINYFNQEFKKIKQ